jgi:NADH-quinone oxidoreductase subunit J
MDLKSLFFYAFSFILLLASFRVITAKNTVHAALWLVLAFFQAAAIWLLLKAEFLAISLVLVYVGAVMVLFLFVVMMMDINTDTARKGFWKNFPLAAALGAVIAIEMALVLLTNFAPVEAPKAAIAAQGGNTKALGVLLYTQYIYPVQIAAVILLVAIVAAIALTLRERKDSKYADPAQQVRVRAADRMQVVKMDATKNVAKEVQQAPATDTNSEKKA